MHSKLYELYFSGNAVGLILPPEVSDDVKKGFEYLLNQLTAVKQSEDLSQYEDYMALSSKWIRIAYIIVNRSIKRII